MVEDSMLRVSDAPLINNPSDKNKYYHVPDPRDAGEPLRHEDVEKALKPLRGRGTVKKVRLQTNGETLAWSHLRQQYPRASHARPTQKYWNMAPYGGDSMFALPPQTPGDEAEDEGEDESESLLARLSVVAEAAGAGTAHNGAARIKRATELAAGQFVVCHAPSSPWHGSCYGCRNRRDLLECRSCERSYCEKCLTEAELTKMLDDTGLCPNVHTQQMRRDFAQQMEEATGARFCVYEVRRISNSGSAHGLYRKRVAGPSGDDDDGDALYFLGREPGGRDNQIFPATLVRSQNGEFFDVTAVLVVGTPATGTTLERKMMPGRAALQLRAIFDHCQATNDRDKPDEEEEEAGGVGDGDNNGLDGGQGWDPEDAGGLEDGGDLEDGGNGVNLEDGGGGGGLGVGVVTRRAARLRGAAELRGFLR